MAGDWAQLQWEKFGLQFDEVDADKNGSLSLCEVEQVLIKSGFNGDAETVKLIFKNLDTDGDKKISKQEFQASVKELPKIEMQEMSLRRAFKMMDTDNSGFLTKREIIDAVKTLPGLDVSAEKLADLLIFQVTDKDKKISFDEFLHVFGIEAASAHMREVFKKIDKDNSGFLSKQEIIDSIAADSELNLKAKKISPLLIHFSKNKGTDKINYDEFITLYTTEKP
ncbi:calmodulin-like protein 5 [Patella vulgata]|uniref:calmodulin-like protein 5 n=1 Tax=Patella vulgata TaxID=6465 RepID=UPI0024A88F5C|nr:calmodulin-like protein 5 [Patella vulgata]